MRKHLIPAVLATAISSPAFGQNTAPQILDLPNDCSQLTVEIAENVYTLTLCLDDNLPAKDYIEQSEAEVTSYGELTQSIVRGLEAIMLESPLRPGEAFVMEDLEFEHEFGKQEDADGSYYYSYSSAYYGIEDGDKNNYDCHRAFSSFSDGETVICNEEFSKESIGVDEAAICVNFYDEGKVSLNGKEISGRDLDYSSKGYMCFGNSQRI